MESEQQIDQPSLSRSFGRTGAREDEENSHPLLSSESVGNRENEDYDNVLDDSESEEVEDYEDEYGDNEPQSSWKKLYERVFQTNLLPDHNTLLIGSMKVVEGPFTIKLIKFISLSFAFITLIHIIVPFLTDDRDRNLKLWQLLVFEGNLIVSDLIIFFVVGRMWLQKGVDHLEFIFWALMANLFYQIEPYIKFLQHSVSLYEIHCVWPWELWVFVIFLIPVIAKIVFLHVKYAYQKGVLIMKMSEMFLCALFFVAPLAPSPYFHLHHWYAGWLLGMHANFSDVWWSRAVMAYCWGLYINGIAVYGRDPVLTCEYSYFLSVDQRCPYMDCYQEGVGEENSTIQEMITPDWKNCSADTYHP